MADSSLLVGVSGGPDSLVLLDVLIETGYPLKVATFNHLLRPQSGQEVDLVRQYCTEKYIPFVAGQADVRQYARESGLSIEEAARELRYTFLFHQAQLWRAHAVAVGHTADDQVETILMHLLRGAGPSGLSGMRFRTLPNPWSTTIPLIRPLLSTWRTEIIQYIERRKLPVSLDQSNLDVRFFRNRLRHELVPILEQYNPNIRKALWKTAQVLSDEQIIIHQAVESTWRECVDSQLADAIRVHAGRFNQQPIAVQRALLRLAIDYLSPGLHDIDYDAIERARKFILKPTRSHQADLVANVQLLYESEHVWLARREAELPDLHWPQLVSPIQVRLDIPGKFMITPDWELQASFRKSDEQPQREVLNNPDPYQAWLDADQLELPLVIRTRIPGDRFQPLGLDGRSVKLSDFFINQKLPQRARQRWPIICSGEQICWVPGFRIAHPFRLKDQTRRVVHLSLRVCSPKV